MALGVWDGTWPDYASLLVFEVVTAGESDEKFVRCLFNHEQREIQGCSRTGDGAFCFYKMMILQ